MALARRTAAANNPPLDADAIIGTCEVSDEARQLLVEMLQLELPMVNLRIKLHQCCVSMGFVIVFNGMRGTKDAPTGSRAICSWGRCATSGCAASIS